MAVSLAASGLLLEVEPELEGMEAKVALSLGCQLPEGFVGRLLAAGRVVDGERRLHAKTVVHAGDRLLLLPPDWKASQQSRQRHANDSLPEVSLAFLDDHLLVANKPAGILVHSDGSGEIDTLDARVSQLRWKESWLTPFHVHRLDKGTSGAVLYANHAFAARTLDTMVSDGAVDRLYVAIVCGHLPDAKGLIQQRIGRDRHHAGRYVVSASGQEARTWYHLLTDWEHPALGRLGLVACQLETGRTHQIRVHLQALGCPIVGDALYGGFQPNFSSFDGFYLHAAALRFPHPYAGRGDALVQVSVPVPAPWRALSAEAWGTNLDVLLREPGVLSEAVAQFLAEGRL
ncbi:MAG: RluA family pseudouridine synthase [Alicyclobacillaceae bacterium]|nr:RluA family pseudouridine synthase [Alicyclobacillaceae bacterium]